MLLKWSEIDDKLQKEAPLTRNVLYAITQTHDAPTDEDMVTVSVASSMLLYNQNNRWSQVQQALGLTIDKAGLTKEVPTCMYISLSIIWLQYKLNLFYQYY